MQTKRNTYLPAIIFLAIAVISCNNAKNTATGETKTQASQPSIKEDAVTYSSDTISAKGFVAFDEAKKGKRPAVLVVHEWWGLTDYARNRAKQLAEMGYVAMAVDMYGDGKIATDPQQAMAFAGPFYQNPQLTRTRLDAAMAKLKQYEQVDTSNVAAIGYCFGGFVVLNAAKLGSNLNGVVSFHGSLSGVHPDKNLLKAKVLVCHGAADKLVSDEEIKNFKSGMDSIGADYTFKAYPDALHAFTNPDATELGQKLKMPIAYNAAADTNSWNDMKAFFTKIF